MYLLKKLHRKGLCITTSMIIVWNEFYNNFEHCSPDGKTPIEMPGLMA